MRDIVAECTRCGQLVYENQSHVMVVNVAGGRLFFHAGCRPSIPHKSDLAEENIRTANELYDSGLAAQLPLSKQAQHDRSDLRRLLEVDQELREV